MFSDLSNLGFIRKLGVLDVLKHCQFLPVKSILKAGSTHFRLLIIGYKTGSFQKSDAVASVMYVFVVEGGGGGGGKLSEETRGGEVNQFVTPQMALTANHESMREKYSKAAYLNIF